MDSVRLRPCFAVPDGAGGGEVDSDGPGECSPSPGTPGPYECRSPVEIEFSRVFNRSASSLMYLK